MTVEVSTRQYEFTHGHKPRGMGCWAFIFDSDSNLFWASDTYGQAKRLAIAEARKRGVRRVEVAT